MPWSSIKTPKIKSFRKTKPYVARLKKRSEQRRKKSKGFAKLRESIEKYKTDPNRDKISLKKKKAEEKSKKKTEKKKADIKKEEKKSKKNKNQFEPDFNDPFLHEAGMIMGDYLDLLEGKAPKIRTIDGFIPKPIPAG